MKWKILERQNYIRWRLRRVDRKSNRYYELRSLSWNHQNEYYDDHAKKRISELRKLNYPLDFTEFENRYRLPFSNGDIVKENSRTHSVSVQGITIRFRENMDFISIVIENQLTTKVLDSLRDYLIDVFSKIEATNYEIIDFSDDEFGTFHPPIDSE